MADTVGNRPNFVSINATTFSKIAKQIAELFQIVDKLWPLRQGIPNYGRCLSNRVIVPFFVAKRRLLDLRASQRIVP